MAAVLACVAPLLTPQSARAAPQPDTPAHPAAPRQALQLDVWINGAATGLIGSFRLSAAGQLSASADELRALGLRVAGASPDIPLAQLPGVTARYDARQQRAILTAADPALEPHLISVIRRAGLAPLSPPSPGAVLNYQLFAQEGHQWNGGGGDDQRLSGDFDARLFGPLGVLDNTFTAQTGTGQDLTSGVTRLQTTWSWSSPGSLVTVHAGDLISGGFSWTRPIRMAGLQLQRDFSLRPDLITMPTPTLSGSAAVPSTLEVFTNNQPVYINGVAPGPFQLQDLPVVDGFSETRLVLRDSSGIEQSLVAQFYVIPDLVRAGLLDFSSEVGYARLDYGLRSNDYDAHLLALTSARYGLSDTLTLQGHAEAGAGLGLAGVGAVARLGSLGVGEFAVSASDSHGGVGEQARIGMEGRIGPVFLGGSYQQTAGSYSDLAAATSLPIKVRTQWMDSAAPPRQLTQLTLSTPLNFHHADVADAPMVSLTYAARVDAFGHSDDTISLGLRKAMSRFTLYATAYETVSDGSHMGFFVGLSMPLSSRTTVSAGVESQPEGASAFVETSHQAQAEPGAVGWYAHLDAGETDSFQGEVNYMTSKGRFEGDLDLLPQGLEAQASFSGSLILMDKALFAAPWVQNAFAVVDVGEPNVAIRFQNRFIGVTDTQGRLLAPDLNAYEANRLELDPTTLPLDVEVGSSHVVATPAFDSGVVVRFDLKKATGSALIVLKTPNGEVVAPGSQAILAATGKAFIVGYDGQALIDHLGADNRLSVAQPNGTTCAAQFPFQPGTQDLTHALPTVCR